MMSSFDAVSAWALLLLFTMAILLGLVPMLLSFVVTFRDWEERLFRLGSRVAVVAGTSAIVWVSVLAFVKITERL